MSTQTTISQYFSTRKRTAVDLIKSVNQDKKSLIQNSSETTDASSKDSDRDERPVLKRKAICDTDRGSAKKILLSPGRHNPKQTPKYKSAKSSIKKIRFNLVKNSPASRRLEFSSSDSSIKCSGSTSDLPTDQKSSNSDSDNDILPLDSSPPTVAETTSDCTLTATPPDTVKSLISEQLSPESDQIVPKLLDAKDKEPSISEKKKQSDPVNEPLPSTSKLTSLRQELGLSEIKLKLKGSSRLDKIRDAIKRIDSGYNKLAEIQSKKEKVPRLERFDSIDFEVPCSPVKNLFKADAKTSLSSPSKLKEAVFKSPAKAPPAPGARVPYVSPRKLLEEMRPRDTTNLSKPAYERYNALAAKAGKPCLPLPYSYRILGETFKAIEVVSSMMYNRKETIYFSKLKPSTQELTKKALKEQHLGQILKIFPGAFKLSYERVKHHGKPDTFELAVSPVLSNGNDGNSEQMGPSAKLERQRLFYNRLLDLVKMHHEKYLLSLDPPLFVDKEKLSRWHPGFDLDSCPEIEPATLPQPPTNEFVTSAKQLLGKAREMFIVNPRMERAFEKLSHSNSNTNSASKSSTAASALGLQNALKGLPTSLLEKVRAKQAAKAVEMLTRDPEKARRDIELSRLPQMARILRNLFVIEQKNVLLKSHLLDKLESSFPENLSSNELDRHLKLLIEKTEPWLKLSQDGHVCYVAMNKAMNMNQIYDSINN